MRAISTTNGWHLGQGNPGLWPYGTGGSPAYAFCMNDNLPGGDVEYNMTCITTRPT